MKVIDLYNLVANDEELPEKIKLKDFEEIYTLREDCTGYKWYGEEKEHKEFSDIIHQNLEYVLKQEVEIIEEPQEHKIPEKLKIEQDTPNSNFYIRNEYGTKCALTKHSKIIADKINEILDYLEEIE